MATEGPGRTSAERTVANVVHAPASSGVIAANADAQERRIGRRVREELALLREIPRSPRLGSRDQPTNVPCGPRLRQNRRIRGFTTLLNNDPKVYDADTLS